MQGFRIIHRAPQHWEFSSMIRTPSPECASDILNLSANHLILYESWCTFLRTTAHLEMNSLSHCNRPIPISVSRKRHDVRYLKGFGDSLRSSFNINSIPNECSGAFSYTSFDSFCL